MTRVLPSVEYFPGVVATSEDLKRVEAARRISRLPSQGGDEEDPLAGGFCGCQSEEGSWPRVCVLRQGHRGRCDGPQLFPLGRVELPDWYGWAFGHTD